MPDLQEIVDVLDSKTIYEIRDLLLAENCHGNRFSACDCPIATYIEKHFEKPVLVGGESVCTAPTVDWQEAYLPENVMFFIFDFDLGVYPELVK